MAFEAYIQSGGKRLRCGYTTGTCAALAAAGAARLLLTGTAPETVRLITPKGLAVEVPLEQPSLTDGAARCAVVKDAGDDADVTDGLVIAAQVERQDDPILSIDGGVGVGRVTKPGLDQPVGAAAINRVPRLMIGAAVREVCEEVGYEGGLRVTISVPEGAAAVQRTFNPHLGIQGGISILGTSGIVEPMSVQALIDTIALELRQAAALGTDRVILTPGNYGEDFLHSQGLDTAVPVVKCSNFIGEALDTAGVEGFRQVLLVGHIGKLVKLAGGIMNTHSRWADCRTELFCAHAAVLGAGPAVCQALLDAATTDACLDLLIAAGLLEPVLNRLLAAIQLHLERRAAGAFQVGAILFSNEHGPLGQTGTVETILEDWR